LERLLTCQKARKIRWLLKDILMSTLHWGIHFWGIACDRNKLMEMKKEWNFAKPNI